MATTKEAVAQLAALPERVSVLETQVDNINEKLVDLKVDVKEMHDCLDQTRDLLAEKLEKMQEEYRNNSSKYFEHADKLHAEDQDSHNALDKKIKDLEQFKTKWVYMTAGGIAVLGFMSGHATALSSFFK
jgi:tetrahydromethanopterin S-methyltransferase subunit B